MSASRTVATHLYKYGERGRILIRSSVIRHVPSIWRGRSALSRTRLYRWPTTHRDGLHPPPRAAQPARTRPCRAPRPRTLTRVSVQ